MTLSIPIKLNADSEKKENRIEIGNRPGKIRSQWRTADPVKQPRYGPRPKRAGPLEEFKSYIYDR
jgi:hypothetical protein